MLTDLIIQEEAAMSSSYTRGCQYYQNGHVRDLQFDSKNQKFAARVMGSKSYKVRIDFDKKQEVGYYHCDCVAFSNYYGACKHVVAVLKLIQKQWGIYFDDKNMLALTQSTKALLSFFYHDIAYSDENRQAIEVKLIPTYAFSSLAGVKQHWLEFTIGQERMYVVKDIPQLLAALEHHQDLEYGKNFTLQPQKHIFDALSMALLTLLRTAYVDEKQRVLWGPYSSYSSTSAFGEVRRFKLTNSMLLQFFQMMGENSFTAMINQDKIPEVEIVRERPPVNLSVQAMEGGLRVAMQLAEDVFYGLDSDCQYIYHNERIYRVDEIFASYIKPLLTCFREQRKSELHLPETTASEFFSSVLPALEKISTVQIEQSLINNFYRVPLEKQVYVDKLGEGISARVAFCYEEMIINPLHAITGSETNTKGKQLLRSIVEENDLLNVFRRYQFQQLGDHFVLVDEEATYRFLQHGLAEIKDLAEVFYTDDVKKVKIKRTGRVSAAVRLNTKTDMLEFSLAFEEMVPRELLALLASYKLKKRYHRMQDGAFVPLDSPEFQTTAELVEQLGLTAANIERKVIELPKYRAMYLDSLLREAKHFSMERNSAFKKMVQDVCEPQDMEVVIPAGIQGKLRDYQKTGFKWMKSLAAYGFGGILADDMGLGKTLQVLTFILSEQSGARVPSIVIVPTSLVYNWQEEAQKFAPTLKLAIVAGHQEERTKQLQEIEEVDLVVTSYALIKRDIEYYENRKFKYCFLDEAQHIKNPNTLNAKAVKKIKATGYFALTGTPIENTLTELWSIFDFLMPGYLRSHSSFTKRFEIPIIKNGQQKALTELGRHIKPFILRRMKKEVLSELPEKIESRMTNEMTPEQAKLYAAWLLQVKHEFDNEVQSKGFEKSQIKILSLLTRLRQICCHPSLFIENYQGSSGKLDMLKELLEDAVGGGHRILLFSQFTGMLSLIKDELAVMKISYHYLDGSTKAEERMRLVNRFNAGEKEVFLISLKAGGTGLNLTGADMVIHYDPWWNPAVEDQATDRAYRIGQKNSVQVCKLITKNTIEEKIYALQQKKKEMIDTLIKPGENFLTKMSEEEIRKLFDF